MTGAARPQEIVKNPSPEKELRYRSVTERMTLRPVWTFIKRCMNFNYFLSQMLAQLSNAKQYLKCFRHFFLNTPPLYCL